MSLIFWMILQLVLLFGSQQLVAAVVLLPAAEQSFELYSADCSKENYLCTQTVVKDKIISLATPKYDQLILDLDLQSTRFTASLTERIKDIAESEMISMEQLESLVNILQRAEEINSNKLHKILRVELTQLQEMITRAPAAENFNYFIFKKPLNTVSIERLKSYSFKPLIRKINFQKETLDQHVLNFKNGTCTKSQLSETGQTYFSGMGYIFNEEKDCSWTDSVSEVFKTTGIGSESKYKMTSKQKDILLWSAVAIGAGLLLSQYELTIEY